MSDAVEPLDLALITQDARTLRNVGYNCDCQVGGVDATSIDADYLHEVGRRTRGCW